MGSSDGIVYIITLQPEGLAKLSEIILNHLSPLSGLVGWPDLVLRINQQHLDLSLASVHHYHGSVS